jgi:hypothetical protein
MDRDRGGRFSAAEGAIWKTLLSARHCLDCGASRKQDLTIGAAPMTDFTGSENDVAADEIGKPCHGRSGPSHLHRTRPTSKKGVPVLNRACQPRSVP